MKGFRAVFVALLMLAAATEGSRRTPFPPVWPIPADYTNGTAAVLVNPVGFSMSSNNRSSRDLNAAFQRFLKKAFPHRLSDAPKGAINSVTVTVDNYDEPLQLYMNENYTLTVTDAAINIHAGSVFGAYHAMETLSQLISFNFLEQKYTVPHAPWKIDDYPRFPHRGVLIDSSRHFLPVDTIKIIIDSLTYAKYNEMHWHIVDAQSFPFNSMTFPKLAEFGAYSPEEQFTPNDVRDVVEYARQRGIRVMIELDTPGHSAAFCDGMPEVCPTPKCNVGARFNNVNDFALDATKNVTYDVVHGLWGDLASLFFERLMHIGGDEVDYACWMRSPAIMAWLKERNMTPEQLYEYYVMRVQKMVWGLGREVVGWQEIWEHFGTALNKRTIIHQWLPNSTVLPHNVTSHGYRLIWSDSSRWYLDHLDVTWEQMYTAEPCNGVTDYACKHLILGGEACMWGETVDTSDSLQTIWPRAAAVAERLWSPVTKATTWEKAEDRFFWFRCLLNHRGIAAAPSNNTAARENPPFPGSCYDQ